MKEYLIDLNATQAAIRAGYSKKSARKIGSENLTKLDIQIEVRNRLKTREKQAIKQADDVIDELVQQYYATRYSDRSSAIKCLELLGRHFGMWGKTKAIQPRSIGRVEIVTQKS